MSEHDFDESIELMPIKPSRKNWQKIFKTALEDLTGLIAPKTIVYCEGKLRNSIDEQIFNEIFLIFMMFYLYQQPIKARL